MKYKVGDKVLIKSADWYYKNRAEMEIDCGDARFIPPMAKFCGQIVTISSVPSEKSLFKIYRIKEDGGVYDWTDKMIEGIFTEENKPLTFGDSWECPQGYQFVDENGNVVNATKIILEKKKKEYPKTYEGCAKELGYNQVIPKDHILGYMGTLLSNFQQLLICRDAYWKIAGEEMGLEKPWGTGDCKIVYGICREKGNIVKRDDYFGGTHTFEFPIREMRDAFYENFKELIENCKELM